MRIGFITQWYPPEHGTGLSASIAESMVRLGHTVDVLTGFPNYPTGKVYEGYAVRPYQREVIGPGLTLHRAPLFPSHDASALRRALNYSSFAFASAVVSHAAMPRPDAWLVYSSPATAALATLVPGPKAAPTALLIQDLWPDSVLDAAFVRSGATNRSMEWVLGRFCDATYRRATKIGVISPSMRSVLETRGVPADKIYYTPNWSLDAASDSGHIGGGGNPAELGLPARGTVFLYAGNLGGLQDLTTLVQNFPTDPSAQLVLMGNGIVRHELESLARPRDNVHIKDAVPASEVARYLACADVLVVSLADRPLLRATMPSKVQSYLARGKPVLVHGAGDVADVVTSADAGLAARPGDAAGLRDAVMFLARALPEDREAMGQRARQRYRTEFDRSVGAQRLAAMLEDVVEKGRART